MVPYTLHIHILELYKQGKLRQAYTLPPLEILTATGENVALLQKFLLIMEGTIYGK